MSEITLWIDEQEVRCEEGEYLLQVARARGIFIPAICYLTRCSPTLACKLCMVEADGKRVYACNAKAKEGMRIQTKTPEILEERRAIMQVYCINHPLECGVCDKSGECELQNYTLEMGVYTQDYAIRDSHKPKEVWGQALYDPSLCIVCERCVTVCKDRVGSAHLKTVKRDADMPDKELKDSMPKDAFGVWTKMSKSLIGHTGEESCVDCGECIAVCPVGALSAKHFHYKSNAWELTTTWSACAHCTMGCLVGYEGKEGRIERVKSDWNFGSLCGAGRFGFDFGAPEGNRDPSALKGALEAFKRADTIAFSSYITNEEALLLQKLKETRGYKLYNPEAKRFGAFLNAFREESGGLYNATLEDIRASEVMIALGGALRHDTPVLKHAVNNALKMNKGSSLYYLHPLQDKAVESLAKGVVSLPYAPLDEERVVAWLLQRYAPREALPVRLAEYLAQQERTERVETLEGEEVKVEERYHSALAEALGFPPERLPEGRIVLAAGSDLYAHPRALNIARLLGMLQKHTEIKILLVPPTTNALGVALICDLDEEKGQYTIGYNTTGDYVLSSIESKANLLMPALNQQEGTFTNIDKRVIPIHPALPYEGYELNDIAKALGLEEEHTIDYTPKLPKEKGFLSVAFDSLPNHYDNDGREVRGYLLAPSQSVGESQGAELPATLPSEAFNAYARNPESQFSPFTARSGILEARAGIYASAEACAMLEERLGVKVGENLKLAYQGASLTLPLLVDTSLGGDYLAVSTYEYFGDFHPLFPSGYRFSTLEITKAEA